MPEIIFTMSIVLQIMNTDQGSRHRAILAKKSPYEG